MLARARQGPAFLSIGGAARSNAAMKRSLVLVGILGILAGATPAYAEPPQVEVQEVEMTEEEKKVAEAAAFKRRGDAMLAAAVQQYDPNN